MVVLLSGSGQRNFVQLYVCMCVRVVYALLYVCGCVFIRVSPHIQYTIIHDDDTFEYKDFVCVRVR